MCGCRCLVCVVVSVTVDFWCVCVDEGVCVCG